MKLKALAMAAVVAMLPMTMQAAELPDGPHIVTSGTGTIEVQPDMATLLIEVKVSDKDAAVAKKQNDERVAKYMEFLEKNGIAKADIDAANIQTRLEYNYPNSNDSSKVVKDYAAVRQVKVTVRQLDKLNTLLDGALSAGLNEIRDVTLGVAKDDTYRNEVRKKAVENAKVQAEELAKDFGVKLGPVFSIRYRAANPMPVPMMRAYKSDAVSASGIDQTYQQQSISFNDQVDVVFDIQR
ncbi:oxidative stress defense protein [Budviciaceae bacterium CWB-B4]|uniref:Oxidative stress defense protein n=2 Tax=Limnobaculum xujianqingii TaxID=2738837 RepID=A0A9D7FU27_9GAMM|nr:oxidative stress defense protein [Limnobaculum xujianqingii]MBK5073475.1 oxidative stress defense protein [Limnobaculum xujianqingii]MBK5176794.1 oxidative stress defense protein [Limnobaculum xujianqingii]